MLFSLLEHGMNIFPYSFPAVLSTSLCSFDHRVFRWMITMVFAVDEINRNSTLLPGVRLGYRILDSCAHVQTSLRGGLSMVTGRRTEENIEEGVEKSMRGCLASSTCTFLQ